MADPYEKDKIDKVKRPGHGVTHSRHSETPYILPAEGEEGPQKDNGEKASGYQERPSHMS
jgi:hypothetical protein